MPAWVIILIVVAVVVVLAAALLARRSTGRKARRTSELQERFGPEYDRLVGGGSRKAAERELAERERQHAALDIRALPEADRARFSQSWQDAQLSFLDDPAKAVHGAESLVLQVMMERGYPTADNLGAQADQLSVEHARQLDNLRSAQAISTAAANGKATTEDLRQAMIRYRALFADLLRAASAAYPDEPAPRVAFVPATPGNVAQPGL